MIGRDPSATLSHAARAASTRSFVRQRMRACEFDHAHGVARLAQARDDAPVVFVSAGDRVERRRHDQRNMHQAIAAS